MKKTVLKITLIFTFFNSCANGDFITIEGKIKIKGSVPHNYIVLEDSKTSKDYKIINSKKFNLNALQNRVIKAKVKLIKKEIGANFPTLIEIVKLIKPSK